MVSDLDIVSGPELSTGIRGFVETNKIRPTPLVLILSQNVYFEKNYPGSNPPSSEEMDEFINTVPFFTTSSKLFRVISGYKQVVINRDFYECLKSAFEELGFQVMAVVPGFALGQGATAEFTAETCRLIYRKMDQIIVDSLIGAGEETFHQKEQVYLEKNKIIIIIVFFLLLGVLAGTAYLTLRKLPSPRRNVPARPIVVHTPVPPLPTPAQSLTSTPSAAYLQSLTVQILNASGVPGQAASVSALLKSLGFTKIQTGNTSQAADKTQVIMSPQAATSSGTFVTDILKTLYPDLSFEQNSQAKFDLTVIISETTP